MHGRQLGTAFLAQGSNKRAITLDLKTEGDRDILRKLAATSDVFVENYRPGALEALDLGYEALAAVNPAPDLRLVLGVRRYRAAPRAHRL